MSDHTTRRKSKPKTVTPAGDATRAVAAHLLSNRRARGWSVRELSERLIAMGWPLTSDAICRIEQNLRNGGTVRTVRKVSVDDLMALAEVFGIDPGSMLTAPACEACNGAPPGGFTCNECGATS